MAFRFRVHGQRGAAEERGGIGRSPGLDSFSAENDLFKIAEEQDFELGAARAAGAEPEVVEITAKHALARVTLADGQIIWLTRERLEKLLGAEGQSELEISADSDLGRGTGGERGLLSLGVKALKLIGIDLKEEAADWSTGKLIRFIEGKLHGNDETVEKARLYRCEFPRVTDQAGDVLVEEITKPLAGEADHPILVLLHGTFSTTQATFGDLWASEANLRQWREAVEGYGGEVYALEHATLSADPAQNAVELLKLLPKGQRLHLLSHSRGGLVGELLCRDPRGLAAGRREDLGFPELDDLLGERRPRVERFVRVACPAAGTFLLNGKLDVWLGNLAGGLNGIIGLTPLPDLVKELIEGALALMCAVADKRDEKTDMPGLEAMSAQSDFIRKLNLGPESQAPLRVVSGDAEIGGIGNLGQTLATLLADRYWEGTPNDFVVESESMLRGMRRAEPIRVAPFRGGSVNHFRYFQPGRSFNAIVNGLSRDDAESAGFLPLSREKIAPRRTSRDSGRRDAPHVLMLPGFAGSHLAVSDNRIWLDLWSLLLGEFDQLSYRPDDDRVRPDGWISRYYDDLAEDLSRSNRLIELPFDWRLSLADNADILAEKLEEVMQSAKAGGQPVRILAHSIGGLVTLYLINRRRDLWRELVRDFDARFVMAGSPIRGTHRTTMLLTGQHDLLNLVAAIDLSASGREMVRQMAEMPGLLEALPRWDGATLFQRDTWESLHRRDEHGRDDWDIPEQAALTKAERVARVLDERPDHPERIFYLAGQDGETPDGYRIESEVGGFLDFNQEPGLVFTPSSRGDGLTLWDELPDWANIRYISGVPHGDLFDAEEVFSDIAELLNTGNANPRLSVDAPHTKRAQRGAAGAQTLPKRYIQSRPLAMLPDQTDLEAAILHGKVKGAWPQLHPAESAPTQGCRVRVLHSDLSAVPGVVVIGHYQDDPIAGSAAVVDRLMHGELSRFHRNGVYPGGPNSCEIIHDSQSDRTAVVVGLGRPGELNIWTLQRSLVKGLIRYVLHQDDCHPRAGESAKTVQLNSLLVGSYYLPVADSVQALVTAVEKANQRLAGLDKPTIGGLDIVELLEEQAICALQSLDRMGDKLPRSIRPVRHLITRGREQYDQPPRCDDGEWWKRLLIDGRYQSLIFTPLTERAGIPVEINATDRVAIDQLLSTATQGTYSTEDIDAALYELLIPAPFKERIGQDKGLVLIVDEESARYPWEMLRDQYRAGVEPITTQMGLVRQLRMDAYLGNGGDNATGRRALVIGEPRLTGGQKKMFSPLPGARAEAEAVHRLLERFELQSELLVDRPGEDNLTRILLSDSQVLHLSGHGVFNEDLGGSEPKTGMVLGDGIYFGPNIAKQIRNPPEFVFINCCHLGEVGDENQRERAERHRLAANLGTQFIAQGVKAVIVAGWAVNDDAAQLFAETFYEALIAKGLAFGEAVLQARSHTYKTFPRSNTWGAYQCYGEPSFRLSGAQRATKNRADYGEIPRFYARSQLVRRLRDMLRDAGTKSAKLIERHIDGMLQSVPAEWRGAPDVLEAQGRLLAEIGRFEVGIECYHQAQQSESASISLRAIEQKNNLAIRHANQRFNERLEQDGEVDAGLRAELLADIRKATDELTLLLQLGKTSERLSLMGSACKNRAALRDKLTDIRKDLAEAAENYREAEAIKASCGASDRYYPALNRLTAQVLLNRLAPPSAKDRGAEVEGMVREIGKVAAEIDTLADPNVWARTDRVNCDFLLLLLEDRLTSDAVVETLAEQYRVAAESASAREFDSIRQNFRYCRWILSKVSGKNPYPEASLEALDRLYRMTRG